MAVGLWGAANRVVASPFAIGQHGRACVLDKLSFIAPLSSRNRLLVAGTQSNSVSSEAFPARYFCESDKFIPTKYSDQLL